MNDFATPRPKQWLAEVEAQIPGTTDRPDWAQGGKAGTKVLLLDRNESRDPALAAFIQRIVTMLPATTITDYGEPGRVYEKLAALYGVSIEQLMLAAGSEAGIRDVFATFVEPGDAVLMPAPTYIMAPVYCRQFGARLLCIDYVDTRNGPILDVAEYQRTIRAQRPRLVYLPNPNSPTGTAVDQTSLRAIVEAAAEAGSLLLLDEAYYPFHDFTALRWVDDYAHLVISRTFSKAWGLAGLRLGVIVGSVGVMKHLSKVRPLNEANALGLAVLERLLDQEGVIQDSVRRLLGGKAYFCQAMSRLGFVNHAGYGNFCLVDFGESAGRIMRAMEGVAVFRRSAHRSMARYYRITTTTEEQFAPLVSRIETAPGP